MEAQVENDLRHIIQKQLTEISLKNPKFSLRALAKKMKVSPSHLSRFLNGKKQFSYPNTIRILRELELSTQQIERILFVLKEQENVKKDLIYKKNVKKDDRKKSILDYQTFKIVADWYHFPILELIRTKGFKNDISWISRRLSLDSHIVAEGLSRLEALGFIKRFNDKIELSQGDIFYTSNDIQSAAIKQHHLQMITKATEALFEQEVDQREFQALNLNFNPDDLNEAKKEIREFTKRFTKKFSQKSGDEVFQLNIQMFSLTKKDKL